MKKLILIIFCSIPFLTQAQVTTFFEDFEDGTIPAGWTIINANEGVDDNGDPDHTWTIDDSHGIGGTYCIYNDTHPGPADDWFISPLTTLTDGYVFSFWAYGSSTYPDSLKIMSANKSCSPMPHKIILGLIAFLLFENRYAISNIATIPSTPINLISIFLNRQKFHGTYGSELHKYLRHLPQLVRIPG